MKFNLFFIRVDVPDNDIPHYLKPYEEGYEVYPGLIGAAVFDHVNAKRVLSLVQQQFNGCKNARMVATDSEIKNSKENLHNPKLDVNLKHQSDQNQN